MKLINTILAVALLGTVSAPVLAHRFDAKLDEVRMSLDIQGEHLIGLACHTDKMDMCATLSGIDLALDLLRDIPTEASDAEIEKGVRRASLALRPLTDEHALAGQYAGLSDSEKARANTILDEVIHKDGDLMIIMGNLKKSAGK